MVINYDCLDCAVGINQEYCDCIALITNIGTLVINHEYWECTVVINYEYWDFTVVINHEYWECTVLSIKTITAVF